MTSPPYRTAAADFQQTAAVRKRQAHRRYASRESSQLPFARNKYAIGERSGFSEFAESSKTVGAQIAGFGAATWASLLRNSVSLTLIRARNFSF
jgi:hypothetical protein